MTFGADILYSSHSTIFFSVEQTHFLPQNPFFILMPHNQWHKDQDQISFSLSLSFSFFFFWFELRYWGLNSGFKPRQVLYYLSHSTRPEVLIMTYKSLHDLSSHTYLNLSTTLLFFFSTTATLTYYFQTYESCSSLWKHSLFLLHR
jgi:hypothetical protein